MPPSSLTFAAELRMDQSEMWSLVASIVSVILGAGAVALSVYFFVVGRNTEKLVSTSLTKIEAQADVLQRITGRQMDRLTKYVTEDRIRPTDPAVTELLTVVLQAAKPLASSLPQDPARVQENPALRAEIVSLYIALYYYTALTNYWSQLFLPPANEFSDQNPFDAPAKKSVDQSATDFTFIAGLLAKVDANELAASPLSYLLKEAMEQWRDQVKPAADVFIARERAE